MDTIYHVEFVGGPADGLEITTRRFPLEERRRLSLPARPVAEQFERGRRVSDGHYGSAYLMTQKRQIRENGRASIHLKYDFQSFETLDRGARERSSSEGPECRPVASASFLRRCRDTLARWMSASVDYPLSTRGSA